MLEHELSSTDESKFDLGCAGKGHNPRAGLVKKAYRSCLKHKLRALRLPLSTGRHLLGVLFIQVAQVKLTLRPAVTMQNTAKNSSINFAHTRHN